jgi:hypothetical protein
MTGLPSLPVHSTPTETPTAAPGIEAVSGDLIAIGVGIIVVGALFFTSVIWLHTVTGGRMP